MAIIRNLTFLLLLTIVSCKEKSIKEEERLLVGEWKFAEEVVVNDSNDKTPGNYQDFMISGYHFLPDGRCEYKPGYLIEAGGANNGRGTILFLGTTTTYQIAGKRLEVFNPADSTWDSMQIVNLTADTMILQRKDKAVLKYTKTNYRLDKNESYDQILVSGSGCFGICPINDISVERSGEIIYRGERFNTREGCYTACVSDSVFLRLEESFKKANVRELKDRYEVYSTDHETVSVTFIKDGRIVKTISVYGVRCPLELYWAYTAARYLYQQLSLDTMPLGLNQIPYGCRSFEKKGAVCNLSQSEAFYLWTLLIRSPRTQDRFAEEYTINIYNNPEVRTIRTDGQRFKMIFWNGKTQSYDLGFSFIERNGLKEKFKQIQK